MTLRRAATSVPTARSANDGTPTAPELLGLDQAAVEERRRLGQTNRVVVTTSRPLGAVLRKNLLTRFNLLLGSLFVVIAVVGPLQDGLFGLVVVINSGIAVAAELRAKHTLDRIALLSATTTRVIRSGDLLRVPVGEIVLDDVCEAGPGEEVVADGIAMEGPPADVDESLLSGEARPVHKQAGDAVLSGTWVVTGTLRYIVSKVGDDSYAARLAQEARRFPHPPSELRSGIDLILGWIAWALVPTGALLVATQLPGRSTRDGVRSAVAGVVTMVPEGLVLLVSAALALAAVRLANRRVLVQQLEAVETVSRVDVLCLDKTGTLTEAAGLHVVNQEHLDDTLDPFVVAAAIAALSAAEPSPNATLRAVSTVGVASGWEAVSTLPFSSERRWSGADFGAHGCWVLGAPATLQGSTTSSLAARVAVHADLGRRVVLLARTSALDADLRPELLVPAALIVLEEKMRRDAESAVRFFLDQGVTVKVFSGDHPATVAAVAGATGIGNGSPAADASSLIDDDALRAAVGSHSVIGRMSPEQKRTAVAALRDRGHCVAMVGDGVNDVPALKAADIAVAPASGTPATRAVAGIVLMDDGFAGLPRVVTQGRRVVANIERAACLFVTKSVYALLIALAIGLAGLPFPFLPRHLTVVAMLTLGIPGVVLSLGREAPRAEPGFVGRVLRFAVPAGITAAVATFTAYALARTVSEVSLNEARTTATMALLVVGLSLVGVLTPAGPRRLALVSSMTALYVLIVAVPVSREFFALDPPPAIVVLAAAGAAALGMWALELLSRFRAGWVRRNAAPEAPDSSLRELIDAGESETLEFKSSIRWDRREKRVNKTLERVVAKTVAGFLNGRGGTLLLGVEDTGAICGLDADFATLARPGRDAFERHVRQVLTTHLGGSIQRFVRLSFASVAGTDVCRIEITRADSPVYVREGNDPRLYVRMGNATVALPVDEAIRYVGRRWAGQTFGGLLETVFGRRR